MSSLHHACFSLVFLLAVGLAGCSSESEESAEKVLRFTAIPSDNTTELREKFEPLAEHLSAELGMPVEYVATSSYAASVEAFRQRSERTGERVAWARTQQPQLRSCQRHVLA